MKKQLLSAMLALSMAAASAAAVTWTVTAEELDETVDSSESVRANSYWIFYEDIDTDAIEREAQEKRSDYIYYLYENEPDLTWQEFERLETDYYLAVRRELLEAAHTERSSAILAELGVDPSKAFCSMYSCTIVCELTEAQLEKAGAMEIIKSISPYTPVDFEEATSSDKPMYTTKEEFIQLFTTDENGDYLFGDNIKVDAHLDCVKSGSDKWHTDYLVIYGLTDVEEIRMLQQLMNDNHDFKWYNVIPEDYNGCTYYLYPGNDRFPDRIGEIEAIFLIEDEFLDWSGFRTPKEYSKTVGFDVAPYVVTLGDLNGDYVINASDASDILGIYSELMTDNDRTATEEELKRADVNKDGLIDSTDASLILSYYSSVSTSGKGSLKEYIRNSGSV